MSDAIRFENEDEARAWMGAATRITTACVSEGWTAAMATTQGEFCADELLRALRKRTAPQAQGEDGLPEGWRVDHLNDDWIHESGAWVSGDPGDYGIGHCDDADSAMHNDPRRFPTRAAAIAAVEAHLRGAE